MAEKLSCFVITGFSEKTDPATGRKLNMNLVFEKILKPVCDSFTDPPIDCFRTIDKLYTGTIDSFMYKWILNADIAIADISTLNPNAIYELGVRYALKPFSTIVISESNLLFPFDFNHIVIQKYVHGGNDIDPSEVAGFSTKLKGLIQSVIDRKKEEGEKSNDSPVYDFLSNDIFPPRKKTKKENKQSVAGWDNAVAKVMQKTEDSTFTDNLMAKVSQADMKKIAGTADTPTGGTLIVSKKPLLQEMYEFAFDKIGMGKPAAIDNLPFKNLFESIPPVNFANVSPLVNDLNDAVTDQKNKGMKSSEIKDLPAVAAILGQLKEKLNDEKLSLAGLIDRAEEKKNANSLREALAYFALAIERDANNRFIIQRIVLLTYKLQEPDERTALKLAESILLQYLKPDDLIDVETFGLAGGIYKRLAKYENEKENIAKSCKYYEKGFIVCNDYYNGINSAFMYLLSATKRENQFDKVADYGIARKTWKTVVEICDRELQRIEKDQANKERIWILQSKAQAVLALNEGKPDDQFNELVAQVTQLDTKFSAGTFIAQNNELISLLKEVEDLI